MIRATRTISGTPTVRGTGTITIRATNPNGHADWTVDYATRRARRAFPTQTITPVTGYTLDFNVIKNWQQVPNTPVDFDLAPPGADRWFQGLHVFLDGGSQVRFASTASGQSIGHGDDDLSDQFERQGQFILRYGTNILVLNMVDTSDSAEPYTWAASSAGETFFRSIPAAGADITLTINAFMASAPVFSSATGTPVVGIVGEQITDIAVPEATSTPSATYTVEGSLPAGLAFDTSTRIISGTPTSAGSGTITIRALNPGGIADWTVSYNFAADVDPAAPSIADKTGVKNTALTITLAEGTSGNLPLTYAISNLPTGLSFNPSTREITGVPTTKESKTVTYTVTDSNGDTDSSEFTFTIGANIPSAPTISDKTGVKNTGVNILLPVGTGGDGDLVYTIANLPTGLSFNADTRKITGTPTTEEVRRPLPTRSQTRMETRIAVSSLSLLVRQT